MRRFRALFLVSTLAACQPLPQPEDTAPVQADSIVMERSYCIIGFCPSYRLSVARTGVVHFRPRNFGDTTRVVSETVEPAAFEMLIRTARRIGFWELPDNIGDSRLCGRHENDYPAVSLTIFGEGASKAVWDDLGCRGAPRELRRFEARIDSVAGARRWVPARGS